LDNLNLKEMSPSASSTEPKQSVLTYDFRGLSIFVGRSAAANERLINGHTRKHPHCIWLHARGSKGAHVVLCLGDSGTALDNIALRYAAYFAWKYSNRSKKQVNYAPLQDVMKPDGSRPGIFRTFRTEYIDIGN
jgi:predicted ribosome quality control (RQC) complex YloA/Tae2 family protein